MKPLFLAITLALTTPLSVSVLAATPASTISSPPWVETSNRYADILLQAQAPFEPEQVAFWGVPGYDDKVADLGPQNEARYRAAMQQAKDKLTGALAREQDINVKQDLQIMIDSVDNRLQGSLLDERLLLPWTDASQLVFTSLNLLLSDQTPAARRAKALDRLKRYAGETRGSTSIFTLARQRYEERLSNPALLQPTKLEVERALANVQAYADGLTALFKRYKIAGGDKTLAAVTAQMKEYAAWTRDTVLPKARTDTRLPPELYAFKLKQYGIDIDPNVLIQRAQLEFMETRAAMQQLAPQVAKAHNIAAGDYRAVIKALKRDTIPADKIEPHYHNVIAQIDGLIRQHGIVDVPQRPLQMRLGSAAESAAQPAPHYLPPPLIGNTGQQGQFVLTIGNPDSQGAGEQYDDFNFSSAAWTLSAHEGRPGHDLQFAAMVERGISLARTMFAFNSVNVEGWALYAEAEMVPYEPADGQLIALQFRLLRAARAMLDPMLNLGLIDRERARVVLEEDVGLSPAMARQELDRYAFKTPGQAGSYFYGYSRILELRMQTELAMGNRFDRLAFNNFLLDQGLLPPAQLAEAVKARFVSNAQEAK